MQLNKDQNTLEYIGIYTLSYCVLQNILFPMFIIFAVFYQVYF